jgi:uncharacterized protein YndB with AHSA1/START domain
MIEGRDVVHELDLPAGPAEVYELFVDPAKLVSWIGLAADLEPRPGGRFRFEVMPGQFCEGEYVELDPPHRLVLTWGWSDPRLGLPPGTSRVEVTLAEHAAGTRLRLVHTRLPGDLRAVHDEGWGRFLERLSRVVAGRDAGAYPAGELPARLAEPHS